MTRAFTADHRILTALRLRAQRIAGPVDAPGNAVHHLLAVQAQDYRGALWSVGLRTVAPDRDAIERELDTGGLVRSWPMRGTLHLTAVDDLGWMLDLTRDRVERSAATRHRQLGLTDDDFARAAGVVEERLRRVRLDRRALLDAIDRAGVSTDGQRGAHLIGWLARAGRVVICAGTEFARWEDRMPPRRPRDREAALAELAERYLRSHGPATVRDLAWWSGLPLGELRPAVAEVRDRLESIMVGGVEYLMDPAVADPAFSDAGDGRAGSAVQVLPGFDEYVLGYADRSAALAGGQLERVNPGANGMLLATLVVDGEVVGTWRRDPPGSDRVVVSAEAPLPRRRHAAIRAAFRRWGRFVGREVEVVLDP